MRSRLVQERYPYLVNLNPRIVLSSQGRHLSVVDVVVVGDSSVSAVVFGIGVESCNSAVGGDEG